jgi:hypothetical protein
MRRYFGYGAAILVILVNAWVLTGVARNRLGEPDATLTLSEREALAEWSTMPESSAVILRLAVNHWMPGRPVTAGQYESSEGTVVVEPPRLAQLGFDVVLPLGLEDARRSAVRQLPRRAWAVVQFDGDRKKAWTAAVAEEIARRDRAAAEGKLGESGREETRALERRLHNATRLFLVDVGPDPDALRRQYPDRSAYVILPCEVDVELSIDKDAPACEPAVCRLRGRVSLLTKELLVPLHLRAQLPRAGPHSGTTDRPVFEAVVKSGARRELWIEAIRPGAR